MVRATEPDPQRQRPGGTTKPRGSQDAAQFRTGAEEDPGKSIVAYGSGRRFQTHSWTSVSSVKESCPRRCGIPDERNPASSGSLGEKSKKEVALSLGLGSWVRFSLGNKIRRVFFKLKI